MPGLWNPNSTATKGLEWPALASSGVVLDSGSKAAIARIPSLAAETITTVQIYVPSVSSAGTYVLDIFAAGNEDIGPISSGNLFIARPNEDVALTVVAGSPTNTAGNRYQNINEATLSTANYLTGDGTTGGAATSTYDGRMGVGVGNFAGAQILSVTLKARASANYANIPVSDLGSGLLLGGSLYSQATADSHNLGSMTNSNNWGMPDPNPPTRYITWNKNPRTGVGWTAADVEALDTTDAYRWTYTSSIVGYGYAYFTLVWTLDQAWLEVSYTPPTIGEHRVATGSLAISSPGWQTFTVAPPAGGSWAKAGVGSSYDYMLRRSSGSGSLSVRTLDSGAAVPIGHTSYLNGVLGPGGVISSSYAGTGIGAASTAVLSIIPRKAGPVNSNDAQPYAEQVAALVRTTTLALGSNDSEFEGGIGTWQPWVNATVAQSGAQAKTGSFSMLIRSLAAGGNCSAINFGPAGALYPIAGGSTYSLSAWFRAAATTRSAFVVVQFFDSTGAFISSINGNTISATSAGWTQSSITSATAPTNASTCFVAAYIVSPAAANEDFYVDTVSFTGTGAQLATQNFSGAAALTYGYVQARVKHGGAPSADLLVKVRKQSDASQVGGTLTITKAIVDALATSTSGWKTIALNLASSATLATGTQYYLEFSSTSAGAGTNTWFVLALDTTGTGNDETFGAASSPADQGSVNGTRSQRYTLVTNISQVPAVPAGLAATVLQQAFPLADASHNGVTTWDYVHLAWTATANGAPFRYYELQRSLDAGGTWQTIRTVPLEATHTFDDYEGPRGAPASYRVQVVFISGVASGFSGAVTATPAAPGCGACAYGFVSNERPDLNCAYDTVGGDFTYKFPSAAEVVFDSVYQRDFQLSSQPTEKRGVTFDISVWVSFITTSPAAGRGVRPFQKLRDLSTEPTLSYVAVLDPYGNRWLAKLQVPTGDRSEPAHSYIAHVTVTEVTATSSIPST